ncbi:MAG: lytic transglycosylase domain-containing protein [Clostridiales bacterium]|nr:lytic transglycosylase domain-containing protein [Clostridiales bacterium]
MRIRDLRLLFIAAVIIIIAVVNCKSIIRYFYPLKYEDIIRKYSQEYNIDPYLIMALINVESHYNPDATSKRDAKGLMQITSQTGEWGAKQLNIRDFKDDMLYDPDLNIKIGCWYINNLRLEFNIKDSEDDIILMLAAYNGGSGNVRKWLQSGSYSKNAIGLDQIPFAETQQYVKKVIKNYKIYRWIDNK